MTLPAYAPTSLLYMASDRRHRPVSHPVVMRHLPDESAFYRHIARRIVLLRASRGWTQRELGARVGVSSVSICHWERQQTRPSAWNIDRLERAFATQVRP